jgi:hypothetical protein
LINLLTAPAARQDVGLHRGAHRHHLVGVQFRVRFAFEIHFHATTDVRDARRAADEDDFIHVLHVQLRVAQRRPALVQRAVDERLQ